MESHRLFKKTSRWLPKILLPALAIVCAILFVAAVKNWPQPFGIAKHFVGGEEKNIRPKDWCAEHGVPESLCTLCNPELREEIEWCGGHDLPEGLCTLCNPELIGQFALCEPHRLPEHFCRQCASAETSAEAVGAGTSNEELSPVQLVSRQIAEDAGIEVRATQLGVMNRRVRGNGVVTYNQNRFTQIRPRVEGIVGDVRLDVGEEVRRGDVLAEIDSAALGGAKADYLAALSMVALAQKNVERIRSLVTKGITAEKNLFEAEAELQQDEVNVARTRGALLNFGVTHQQIDRFVTSGEPDSILEITAPQDGVVVERFAVEGEAVEPTTQLFNVADLTSMWVLLDLEERDLLRVKVGQAVTFQVAAFPSTDFRGTLTWISPEVNPQTRTVQVRAELDNGAGLLRANMFGSGTVETDSPQPSLLVPKEAVQMHNGVPLVFVKRTDTLFEPRAVRIGQQNETVWEIESGIEAGEQVVTTGSFLFKTELQKGSIGAGCCAGE